MSPGATFERVYEALKLQLGSGRFRPGEHLDPRAFSDELNASITPVRDALHRLVGEGLVDAPRRDGFRMPPLTEVGLRHLYTWNQALLALALRTGTPDPPPAVPSPPEAGDAVELNEQLFVRIARLGRNPEHESAVARLNERLRLVRRTEARLRPEMWEEIGAMEALISRGDLPALRGAVSAYHRRRERNAPQLVAMLLAP